MFIINSLLILLLSLRKGHWIWICGGLLGYNKPHYENPNIWGGLLGVCGGFWTKLKTFRSVHRHFGQMFSLVRQLFGDMQKTLNAVGYYEKSQYLGGLFGGVRGGFRTKLKTFCSAHGHFRQLFSLVRQILIPGGYDPLNPLFYFGSKKPISPIFFT